MNIREWFGRWFQLTGEERAWIAVILGIFLIGLVARAVHLATADPFDGTEPGAEAPAP